ncbi:MAG: DUF2948 family protein [Pseudomonadota bacterium]|nr:DUF2948 family protein [Pseudomonadota bacterium]
MSESNLKLAATDAEDLAVLSVLLQDAVVPMSEMIYLADESRFVLVANRFRWEAINNDGADSRVYERIKCGLTFDRVIRVRRRKVNTNARERVLELLALDVSDEYVDLIFAGDAVIRLYVERILCHAEDFGDPWPTQWRPDHDLEDG